MFSSSTQPSSFCTQPSSPSVPAHINIRAGKQPGIYDLCGRRGDGADIVSEAASAREPDFSSPESVEADYLYSSLLALPRKSRERSLPTPPPFTPKQEQLWGGTTITRANEDRVIQRQQSQPVLYRDEDQFCAEIMSRVTIFLSSVLAEYPRLYGRPFRLYAGFGGTGDKGSCARPPRVQNPASVAAVAAPPPPPLMDYHPRPRRHNRPIQQPHHW